MDPPLKIAVVATNSWYLWNFRKETLAEMIAAGHEVLCICGNPDYFECLRGIGVSVRNVTFGPRGLHLGAFCKAHKALRTELSLFQPDVVLGFTLQANAQIGLARRQWGRWVAVIAGQGALAQAGALRRWMTFLALRPLMRRAAAVAFQNEVDLKSWNTAGLVLPERASLMAGSGVDLEAWTPEPADGPIDVLCHARLLRAKGIGHFLYLAKRAKERGLDVRFHLAGFSITQEFGGFPMAEIEAAAMRGEITFHGALDDVRPLFKGRTIGCLLTEYGEGKPRSLIEALAAGRPLLMSKIAGCDDLVCYNNGLAVDLSKADWSDQALEFIKRLSRDPMLYRTLAENSRTLAEVRFGVRDNIKALMSLIEGR